MAEPVTRSVRGLARALGVSHTTVSDALRNNPRVHPATRERVQRAAREAGYTHNPLAGALMSEMRRSGVGTFRGVLAIVDLESEAQRENRSQPYHNEVMKGAGRAAERQGFSVDAFVLGREHVMVPRLGSILESRGIRGLLVLPASGHPDLSKLNWEHFAGVYTDYLIDRPALDCVCADHFRSMFVALNKLRSMGYHRPGLVLHQQHDERLLYRWEAAYRAYLQHHPDCQKVTPMVTERISRENFATWFNREQPDAVMAHAGAVLGWMQELGAKVPETHGYCCLNVTLGPQGAAGLDLQPGLIGEKAMEALIAQIHRNDYGIPQFPSVLTLPAVWRDGPTVRAQGESAR